MGPPPVRKIVRVPKKNDRKLEKKLRKTVGPMTLELIDNLLTSKLHS